MVAIFMSEREELNPKSIFYIKDWNWVKAKDFLNDKKREKCLRKIKLKS